MNIIIGTAGHIDHGKTALIRALTGTDTDRLPEEKRRGITIDLGFAEMEIDGIHFGFVDVPGHERFVKNMLAGTGGIDMTLLVIAADEGVMPQTREHFDICRLLGIEHCIIALTKSDLVENEMLEMARIDAAELVKGSMLENAPVVVVSSHKNEGINDLIEKLALTAHSIPPRGSDVIPILPIDRSFSVKGFGTVVTGTLKSGQIQTGEELELLPQGERLRVRGLQTHSQTVDKAFAGQRTALNLAGIDHAAIKRGMMLTAPNILRSTQIINAQIEVLKSSKKSIRSRQRVRVHIGTLEALARIEVLNNESEIKPGSTDFAQVRLEEPTAAILDEAFIIRSYSPQTTIAGGRVLDSLAGKHRRKDIDKLRPFLATLSAKPQWKTDQIKAFVEFAGNFGISFVDLQARTGRKREILQQAVDNCISENSIADAGNIYFAKTNYDDLLQKTLSLVQEFHIREPLKKGILRETLRDQVSTGTLQSIVFDSILKKLCEKEQIVISKDLISIKDFGLQLSADESRVKENLEQIYNDAGLEPPKLNEALAQAQTKLPKEHARKIFQVLLDSGDIIKVSEDFYFSRSAIDNLVKQIKLFAAKSPDRLIDVAKFKEIADISRKYAIPLLEYFDRERITVRSGDKRLIL